MARETASAAPRVQSEYAPAGYKITREEGARRSSALADLELSFLSRKIRYTSDAYRSGVLSPFSLLRK